MRFALLIGCSLFCSMLLGQDEQRLRKLFFESVDANTIQRFYNSTRMIGENNALYLGYRGVAAAMNAANLNGVHDKFNAFSQGKSDVERAIAMDPNSHELRFLRFAIQSEIPVFLGYSGNIKGDVNWILSGLENSVLPYDYWYWQSAIAFICRSDDKSNAQFDRLQKFIIP
jgi:hypothetical protein